LSPNHKAAPFFAARLSSWNLRRYALASCMYNHTVTQSGRSDSGTLRNRPAVFNP
jgi:hypothetical protein